MNKKPLKKVVVLDDFTLELIKTLGIYIPTTKKNSLSWIQDAILAKIGALKDDAIKNEDEDLEYWKERAIELSWQLHPEQMGR